jgi:hypothetical protein
VLGYELFRKAVVEISGKHRKNSPVQKIYISASPASPAIRKNITARQVQEVGGKSESVV